MLCYDSSIVFTVVDFSKLLPGPYATKRLRELGFRVTRVQLPRFEDPGDKLPMGPWLNRGKRTLVFDFRKPAGRRRLEALLKRADVLVEGFRPGLMDRLGLGWKRARLLNPRLVYCSITGYPARGPWAGKAGHDLNFQAVSGLLSLGAPGPFSGTPADVAGSMAAVEAILAALLARERTGKGRRLSVSIAEAFHRQLAIPLSGPEWFPSDHPMYRLYETADGRQIAVGALEPQFRSALTAAVGEDLAAAFKSKPLSHWRRALETLDGCACAVLTLPEAKAFFASRTRAPRTAPRRRR
jgi:alpha-methylacyl-CoA racemase